MSRPEDSRMEWSITGSVEDVLTLLERYRLRAHRMARAQYLSAKHAYSMHLRLGIPVVILTAIVGTAIFASAASNPSLPWVISTGLVALLAAVLASLQTFLGYAERAAKHRAAGGRYASIKRDLDVLKLQLSVETPELSNGIEDLSVVVKNINEVEQESLDVLDRFYDQARAEQEKDAEGI